MYTTCCWDNEIWNLKLYTEKKGDYPKEKMQSLEIVHIKWNGISTMNIKSLRNIQFIRRSAGKTNENK